MDIVTYGALNKKVGEKLSSNQGTQNAGKMLGINNEGEIQPIQVLGGNVSVTETLESGEDYSMVIEEGEPTAVTSVAGKYGTVTLDAGDIEYDEQEVYNSGTVGKEVGDLKSQIAKDTKTEIIDNFTSNKYISLNGATVNLTPGSSSSGTACIVVECSAGDVFTVAGDSGSTARLYGFVDASQSENSAVSLNVAIANMLYPMTVIVAPENTTHLVINKNATNNATFFACKGVAVGESISNLNSIVTALGYKKITQEETAGKYLYSTGQAGSSGSLMNLATACVTKPFQLKKGNTIFVKCRGGSNSSVMWVIGKCNDANYSGIKVLVPTIDNAERVYTYTVTENAYYFCSYMHTIETLSHFSAEIYVCTSTDFLLEAVSDKQDKLIAGDNITIAGNVISASAADKLVVDGTMVYKNEIKNGDFSNALTDWTVSPANVFSVVDGEMVLNSSGGGIAKQEKVIPSGHNVYIAFDAYKVGNATTLNIFMTKTGGNSILYSESLTDTLAHYAKVSTTSGATLFFQIGGSSGGGVAHIDNVFVFDLTAYFGAGNEPTASEFEALLNATQEYTTEQYAKLIVDTASDIQEGQLSAEVQTKLNAGTTQGNSKWLGKKIGCLGDSITAFDSAVKKYYQYIVEYYPMASFTVQAVSGATISSYYSPIYAKVADLDSDCDIVTVLGGTNDFQHDVALGSLFTESNGVRTPTTDTSTFYGALNTMIQALIAKYPTKRILLLTPLHRGAVGSYPSEYQQNGLGKYFDEYIEAVKKAGAFWSVPVLDLYNDVGINPNVSQQASAYFSSDLLHPNTAGHARMAEIIVGKMNCL